MTAGEIYIDRDGFRLLILHKSSADITFTYRVISRPWHTPDPLDMEFVGVDTLSQTWRLDLEWAFYSALSRLA